METKLSVLPEASSVIAIGHRARTRPSKDMSIDGRALAETPNVKVQRFRVLPHLSQGL